MISMLAATKMKKNDDEESSMDSIEFKTIVVMVAIKFLHTGNLPAEELHG